MLSYFSCLHPKCLLSKQVFYPQLRHGSQVSNLSCLLTVALKSVVLGVCDLVLGDMFVYYYE